MRVVFFIVPRVYAGYLYVHEFLSCAIWLKDECHNINLIFRNQVFIEIKFDPSC